VSRYPAYGARTVSRILLGLSGSPAIIVYGAQTVIRDRRIDQAAIRRRGK